MKEYSSTNRCLRKETNKEEYSQLFLQNISTFSQGFCTWTLSASAPLYDMQNVLGWRFQISDLKQISQNAEMIISTCALFVEHAYKMISLYLPKPSCNIPFFSLGPYELFGRIITASYFITSDTKEICNTNEDYSSYEFFPLSSRAQGIFNTGSGPERFSTFAKDESNQRKCAVRWWLLETRRRRCLDELLSKRSKARIFYTI